MRGKEVRIPILGMNNQLMNDQSLDGLCDSIINLKPKGAVESPYWAPFEKINSLKNSLNFEFTYEFGMSSITDAFWQVRNQVGEFSENPTGSLKRLLVLCQNESRKCIDIIDPVDWSIVKTQSLPLEGVYNMICTRIDQTTIIAILRNQKPFILYYLLDDTFTPQGWPEMPDITYTTKVLTFTEEQVLAGLTAGVQRKATDQYFLVRWAFKLFDLNYVRHSEFFVVKVDAGPTTEYVTVEFTHNGYTESLLESEPLWKSLIRGVAVFCSLPKDTKKAALNDGLLFETGLFPWIDKLPEDKWPTEVDPNILEIDTNPVQWATEFNLGQDNFTHHRFSARVVDTYNSRLLLGGSSVDFAVPRVKTNAETNIINGGPYSNFLTYFNGSYAVNESYFTNSGLPVDQMDPWDYTVNNLDVLARWTPNPGREFKTASVISGNQPSTTLTTPDGQTAPTAVYQASIIDGRLVLVLVGKETSYTSMGVSGLMPPPGYQFTFRLTIGPIGQDADQSILFTVSPSGNSTPFFNFSNASIELGNDPLTTGIKVYHIITIKTDSGTYKRIREQILSEDSPSLEFLTDKIFYPDRRAILYQCVVVDGSTVQLVFEKQLISHPSANYSYAFISTEEQVFELGTGVAFSPVPELSVNDIQQWVPNRIQASLSGQPFVFDLAATYRVGNMENDTILGFGVNLNPTSEGQAGQYPVYAFSDKGVWALEQIGDPTIAFGRITPISNFNGINNHYAITNANNLIIACDNKYIYALAGLESTRIDEAIANDPDYAEYLKQIRIGYHRASDYEELIFSNPFYDYSLCYNLRYKVWYKATERFKFFFYDYPELMGLTIDNVLKDFGDKNTESPVSWSLTTRVIQFQEPYVYKRLYPSYVRMEVKQPLQEDAENYHPVRVQLKGYRDDKNIVYTLFDQSIKTDFLFDPRIYNQFGSMYAYRVIMSGTNQHKQGNIMWFDTDMEYRYQVTRRRHNCSAQYLYTMQNSGISICNCTDQEPQCPHYSYIGTAEESRVITHNLNKIPSVFVTDEFGFLIEVGVQLIFIAGVPDPNRVRLTFEDPVNYRAYFN
jgi:hypothetical protein